MALPSNSCKNLINPVHAQNCKKKSGEMRNSHHPFFFVDSGESTSLSEFLILGNFRTQTNTRTEDVKSPHTYIKIIFFAHMLDMIKIPGCALIAPRSTWSIIINLSILCINCWRNTLRIIDISWRHTQKMVKRMGKIVTKTIVLLQVCGPHNKEIT